MSPRLWIVVKVAASLFLLWVATRDVSVDQVAGILAGARYELVAAGLAVLVAQFPLGAIRWHLINRACFEMPVGFGATTRFLLAGIFFNQVLPSAIGGDAVRAWLIGRAGLGLGNAVSGVLIDRVASLVGLVALMVLTAPISLSVLPEGPARSSLMLATGLLAAGIAVFLVAGDRLEPWLRRVRWLAWVAGLAAACRVLWRRGWVSLQIWLLSLALHATTAGCVYLCALGLGIGIGYGELFVLLMPVLLAIAVPVSIAGWGVRESSMVLALGLAGVAPADAVTLSVLWGLVTIVGGCIAGLAILADPALVRTLRRRDAG